MYPFFYFLFAYILFVKTGMCVWSTILEAAVSRKPYDKT